MDLFDFCACQCQVDFVSCFLAKLRPKRKCFSVVRFSHDAALQRSFLRMLCLYLLLPQLWPLTSNMHTHSLMDTGTQLFLWRYLDSTCQWKHESLLLSLPHRVSTALAKFSSLSWMFALTRQTCAALYSNALIFMELWPDSPSYLRCFLYHHLTTAVRTHFPSKTFISVKLT